MKLGELILMRIIFDQCMLYPLGPELSSPCIARRDIEYIRLKLNVSYFPRSCEISFFFHRRCVCKRILICFINNFIQSFLWRFPWLESHPNRLLKECTSTTYSEIPKCHFVLEGVMVLCDIGMKWMLWTTIVFLKAKEIERKEINVCTHLVCAHIKEYIQSVLSLFIPEKARMSYKST